MTIVQKAEATSPLPKASTSKDNKIRFAPKQEFSKELKKRVNSYFKDNGISKRDSPAMYLKTTILFVCFALSYGLLVWGSLPWWGALLAAVSLGFVLGGIGFNVMHDGGHRSYSKHRWVNRLMFFSLDFLGGSSYLWHWKHNYLHHSYANVNSHDDDLNVGLLGRLAPQQEHRWWHRYQQFYMWGLYGLLPFKWHFFDDYYVAITGRIGEQPIPRPKGWDLVQMLLGKAVFYTWALIVPSLYFSFWLVCAFYLIVTFVEGVVMAVIFQMAHCLEEAEFPEPEPGSNRMEHEWFVHQLVTTVNFAPNNRFLNWFCGGLNFQVEHHLFPQISHVHYPALSKIVEATCKEYGIPYLVHPTFRASLKSHFQWLSFLGEGNALIEPHTQPVTSVQ